MDESTTDAAVQDTQALDAQPVEQPAEAEQSPTSEPTNTNDEQQEATAEPEQSDNSQESNDPAAYWQKKGIDISTPQLTGRRRASTFRPLTD